jgi:hypothetical protein
MQCPQIHEGGDMDDPTILAITNVLGDISTMLSEDEGARQFDLCFLCRLCKHADAEQVPKMTILDAIKTSPRPFSNEEYILGGQLCNILTQHEWDVLWPGWLLRARAIIEAFITKDDRVQEEVLPSLKLAEGFLRRLAEQEGISLGTINLLTPFSPSAFPGAKWGMERSRHPTHPLFKPALEEVQRLPRNKDADGLMQPLIADVLSWRWSKNGIVGYDWNFLTA